MSDPAGQPRPDLIDPDAELAVFRGVLRHGREAFPLFAREGLAQADFESADRGALYAFCLDRWERDWPTDMVAVYMAVRHARHRKDDGRVTRPFFGRPLMRFLADAFVADWWPASHEWVTAEFGDGRADDLPHSLWVATVAARMVHLLAERRRRLAEAAARFEAEAARPLIDFGRKPTPGPRLHSPATEDDDEFESEMRGPAG